MTAKTAASKWPALKKINVVIGSSGRPLTCNLVKGKTDRIPKDESAAFLHKYQTSLFQVLPGVYVNWRNVVEISEAVTRKHGPMSTGQKGFIIKFDQGKLEVFRTMPLPKEVWKWHEDMRKRLKAKPRAA